MELAVPLPKTPKVMTDGVADELGAVVLDGEATGAVDPGVRVADRDRDREVEGPVCFREPGRAPAGVVRAPFWGELLQLLWWSQSEWWVANRIAAPTMPMASRAVPTMIPA